MMPEVAAKLLLEAFVVRSDAYAVQRNTGQYHKVNEQLTEKVAKAHLEGKITVAPYQLSKDSNVKFVCFDFDGPDLNAEFEKAKLLLEKLRAQGIVCLLEFSGKKGYHVLVLCEECSAAEAKRWAEQASKGCEVHEIFPKQEKLNEGGYGNCVKLPFGLHQVSGKRSYLLGEDLKPLGLVDGFKALEHAVKNRNKLAYVETKDVDIPSQDKSLVSQLSSKTKLPEIVKNLVSAGADEGERHERAFIIIKELYHAGFSKKETMEYVLTFNEKCKPPKSKKIIEEHVKRMYTEPEKYLRQKEQEEVEEKKPLEWKGKPLNFIDSKTLMETPREKGFIVDKMVGIESKVATVAIPGSFKTILTLYMAICIANGKMFLGYKTKKQGVAFLEKEMCRQDMMRNVNRIFKGLKLKRKNYPVFFLLKEGDLTSTIFIEKLKDFILKKQIGLVVFDSLIRYTNGEENSAKDMNAIYQAFIELQQDTKVAIDFLHHMNKGGDIRGSTDIKAQVDTVYEIRRTPKTGRFKILNLKNRNGEINDINGEIIFTEDTIKIERCEEKAEEAAAEEYSKFQVARAFILDFAKASCPTETHCFSRAELLMALEAWNADKEPKISKRLIDSTLKHLATKAKALRKGDKIGEYYLNNAENEKIARWIEPIGLGNALNTEPLQTTKNEEVA